MAQQREEYKAVPLTERDMKIIGYRQLNGYARKGEAVFAGSSLAEMFPLNEMLQNLEERRGVIAYNRGISGDTIDQFIGDLDTCVLDLEPSRVFLNIGTNDMNDLPYSEDGLMEKYESVVERIKESLPGTEIFILSYYLMNTAMMSDALKRMGIPGPGGRTNKNVKSANKRLEEIAGRRGCTYVDVSGCLLDREGELGSEYTIEGIHLWPHAYRAVLDRLIPFLV